MKLIYTSNNTLESKIFIDYKNDFHFYADNDLVQIYDGFNTEGDYFLEKANFDLFCELSQIKQDDLKMIIKYYNSGIYHDQIEKFCEFLNVEMDKNLLKEYNESEYTDNIRICIKNGQFQDFYNYRRSKGCCGFFDKEFTYKKDLVCFGFNFGH